MPNTALHKAVINLLLLAMVMLPVHEFGQSAQEMTGPSARSMHMAMMDCCANEQHNASMHSEQGTACGDMTPAGCTLAASLGSCSTMISALVSAKDNVPTQSSSELNSLHPHDRYLSIVLDTLTPPPNSSQA
ncbi:hypothetical protein [Marinobacter lipolyticus]|uniref:hypothetical protein n=1 Tax=Marinobacter lipolyticus TaxID=209639 RepID=UPI003A8CE5C1